ncbi:MAG: adenylyltransferase/cytidyltransferase family protein [Desulfovibrionaceae bacterium]|nr:adenylyltransferase/cytidyltransferase family protein [Desulfovibrionaceae bacterium]MBF0514105.1 adenylyltransferase/cytidyltransferase family protein [Desulfovibrionaceae bacterium]
MTSSALKILGYDDLVAKVEALREEGKIVVLTHGVFDLIHPGIVRHLEESKKQGDILVATVIRDRDVRRGPGRPVFPEELRVQTLAALAMVDYACIVDDDIPFECVGRIAPDIFAKGQDHNKRDKQIHDKILEEERGLAYGKAKVFETSGFAFSTTGFLNEFLDIYPEDTKHYLRKIGEQHSFERIKQALDSLLSNKVLVIGDGIIDEYHYCTPMGRAGKAPLVVHKYLNYEVFAGGAFATANHVAGICGDVTLVTLLGESESREDFVRACFKPNVAPKFFYRKDNPSIIKKRYVAAQTNQKLFEVNHLNDSYLPRDEEEAVIAFIREEAPKCDLVLASDFGHGLISPRIIEVLRESSRVLCVNTQTNGANTGFNLITKYSRPDFVCLDEAEARLAMKSRGEIKEIIRDLADRMDTERLIVTLGKKGASGVGRGEKPHFAPILSTKVVDTIGAGDAVFSYVAPLFSLGLPTDLLVFLGNVVGALAVKIVCNKRSVEKHEVLEFVHALLSSGAAGMCAQAPNQDQAP